MEQGNTIAHERADTKPPVATRVGLIRYLLGSSDPELEALTMYSKAGGTDPSIARLQLPPSHEQWVVNDPDSIEHILKTNQHNYRKGQEYKTLSLMASEGLLVAEGDTWLHHRRLMQPAFSCNSLSGFIHLITEETDAMLGRWDELPAECPSVNLHDEMRDLTLRIVVRTLFSSSLDDTMLEKARNAFSYLNWYLDDRISSVLSLPLNVPTPKNRRCRKAIKDLDNVVLHLISERRRAADTSHTNADDDKDLLGMLMSIEEDTQRGLTDRQLRDQVFTLLVAGHDTTANALSWAFYLLAQNEDVELSLYQEAKTVSGDSAKPITDFRALRYTGMVLDEVLRLYPPAWIISRSPITDDEIGGYHVPADTHLIISPYVTQRDPRFWDEPETFDPQRFSEGKSETRPEFVHFPFGGGARQCIGKGFAQMEATLVLANVAQRYRLTMDPTTTVRPEAVLTLRPEGKIPVTVRQR